MAECTKDTLVRLKNGDRAAFDQFYENYCGHIYNFICTILYNRDLAEDLTQELFLKIWERRSEIDPENNFQAYIFLIARNLVYKESRRLLLNARFLNAMHGKLTDKDSSTEHALDLRFTGEYYESLIEQLPPARKQIYLLRSKQGLSIREIARKLLLSEKTIENQLYQANLFLRSRIKGLLVITGLLFIARLIRF